MLSNLQKLQISMVSGKFGGTDGHTLRQQSGWQMLLIQSVAF